ncbi:ABC transporter substrate-binding protein [Oleiharenicola lentus]|uniref:ABC transporter substrate-binding protein n=1 Tax=Oleiharenicola lentus TaxID=2508720 RepID=UPI003F66DA00
MKLIKLFPLMLGAAAMALAGCGKKSDATAAAANGLVKVRLQTDWYPQPEHGGYYQAVAKGFYAAEGLDVEILPGGPNAQVMSSVAIGRVEFGMTNGDDVIVAIARGLPIKMIGAEMQRDAQGILFHKENPIRSLNDLQGKTVMAGSGSTWIQVVNQKMGVQFNLVPLVGDLARFMSNLQFVQQCFVTNEPFFVRQRGAEAEAILIANDTYEPYRVMLTSDDYIKKNPEIVAKFVRASVRGWVDYLTGDPTPANKLLVEKRNDLTPEFMAYSVKAMNDYKIVLGDSAKGEYPGQITDARINKQIAILQEVGVLDKKVDVKDVVAFEFIPKK